MIWGVLLHLSYNMWEDRECPPAPHRAYSPDLRFDDSLWRELIEKFALAGGNALVLDLGDGVRYRSHPELAVNGAWEVDRLREELAALRQRGIQPLPKLNFSTAHDTWLGPYARCVSTPEYYRVCRDLIEEVTEIFEGPPLFHLGMDEEDAEHQKWFALVTVRQHELWWHDLNFLAEAVRSAGSRPWIWSDACWVRTEEFLANMPRDIVQSNWYYGRSFATTKTPVRTYQDLAGAGFDQIPTGSVYNDAENFLRTAAFCRRRIPGENLLGFLQAPWKPTLARFREHHLAAIAALGRTVAAWERSGCPA